MAVVEGMGTAPAKATLEFLSIVQNQELKGNRRPRFRKSAKWKCRHGNHAGRQIGIDSFDRPRRQLCLPCLMPA